MKVGYLKIAVGRCGDDHGRVCVFVRYRYIVPVRYQLDTVG